MKPVSAQVYRQTVTDMVLAEKAKTVVEIGVYSGLLSRMLADLPCVTALSIIDTWGKWGTKFSAEHMEGIYQGVIGWARTEPKVVVIRSDSILASGRFADASIDFWETDGCHNTEYLKNEIQAWAPKIKKGGIMCGDNYEAPSVARAVDELIPHREIRAKGRIWWTRK